MAIVYDINPRMADSTYVVAPFEKGKAELEKAGYRVISAAENARLIIQEGEEAFVSKNGNWTREGFVYVPSEPHVYLTKSSPIMEAPAEATKAHREGNEFYPSGAQLEQAIANSVKVPYAQKPIPTDRFGEDEITRFIFEQHAQQYGDFLRQAEISEMPVLLIDARHVNKQKTLFARQLWFRNLDNWSSLDGSNWSLYSNSTVRGVPQAAEGSAAAREKSKDKIQLYTQQDISRVLNDLDLKGIESLVIQRLAQ